MAAVPTKSGKQPRFCSGYGSEPPLADCYETLGPAENKCEDALAGARAFFMGFMQGEGRTQGTLFPVRLEELIPDDHICRVIDAFVGRLEMAARGVERAEAAATGRRGYDPRDLRKLYLYGYLQQIGSSRRLEAECRRNLELMWLLGRLVSDRMPLAECGR